MLPATMECLHQCRRCGIIYGCNNNKKRCSQPFGSGYCGVCSSPAATTVNFMTIIN
ncbi:hypothetical protein [Candidatus Nitrososphaera gargensis]|uniref:hypothetical protein n=1 Tax=Candidatus Nitrososphaera gargensis TaxID=497727 RepID=UPI001E2FE195|nr:hypothetical protein [Candidatus Nitrososphaera gargensis]